VYCKSVIHGALSWESGVWRCMENYGEGSVSSVECGVC